MLAFRSAAAAALLCVASLAAAQSADFDRRVYVTPSLGMSFSDKNDMDSGMAFGLIVGKPVTPYFNVELDAGYSKLEVDHLATSFNEYERTVLGVNLVGFLARDTAAVRPFLLLNGSGRLAEFLGEDLDGVGVAIGGGSLFKLSERWDARLDLRYNLDFISGDASGPVDDSTFYTWTGLIGVSYKFGNDPYDSDNDGVPNRRDKCPDTPAGVQVYSDGCPIDLDGDGVPDYLDKCPNTPKGTIVGRDGCELDSDGDSVPDSRDQCPNTPAGVPVNAQGCPLDSDGDGVPDHLDKCPGTRPGTRVDAQGCSLEDSDGDGIPNELDRCPGTPAGIRVGPDGCPLDRDGDGVPDHLDDCPDTPAGAKVLPSGCALEGDCRKPRPGEPADARGCAIERSFVLHGVKFEFDSDRLTVEARRILNEVAETLKAYPRVKVDLEGHTDSIGSDTYNLGLSERRSNAVKAFLVDRGVKSQRMRPVGYGESRPIDSNETEPGRENNRRVELKVNE